MLVCTECGRINRNDVEECIACGCADFKELLVALGDDIEDYWDNWKEVENGE